MNRFNSAEGWVASESVGQDILIPDRVAMNRAMDGDIVAVELLPEVKLFVTCKNIFSKEKACTRVQANVSI